MWIAGGGSAAKTSKRNPELCHRRPSLHLGPCSSLQFPVRVSLLSLYSLSFTCVSYDRIAFLPAVPRLFCDVAFFALFCCFALLKFWEVLKDFGKLLRNSGKFLRHFGKFFLGTSGKAVDVKKFIYSPRLCHGLHKIFLTSIANIQAFLIRYDLVSGTLLFMHVNPHRVFLRLSSHPAPGLMQTSEVKKKLYMYMLTSYELRLKVLFIHVFMRTHTSVRPGTLTPR